MERNGEQMVENSKTIVLFCGIKRKNRVLVVQNIILSKKLRMIKDLEITRELCFPGSRKWNFQHGSQPPNPLFASFILNTRCPVIQNSDSSIVIHSHRE
jgi:hypothetical protein